MSQPLPAAAALAGLFGKSALLTTELDDAQLRAVLDNWAVREAARSADALEAVLESIRSRLCSSRVELHYKANSGLEP